MKTIIIIPAYNEEECIENVLNNISLQAPNCDVLVVNDCSRDSTLQVLRDSKAKYVDLSVNLGIGGAVQTGYQYALKNDYDIAVQIDADGQHDPEYISKVIEPIISGEADIVIGSRFINKEGFQSTGIRRFGINFLSSLIKVCSGKKIYDVTSGFRAVSRKFIQIYAEEYPVDYPEPEAIMSAIIEGAKVVEVPVIMNERQGGESSINAIKSVYYMIKVSLAIILRRVMIRGGR